VAVGRPCQASVVAVEHHRQAWVEEVGHCLKAAVAVEEHRVKALGEEVEASQQARESSTSRYFPWLT
jgi:hypothetical protein